MSRLQTKWSIAFDLTAQLEVTRATVSIWDDLGDREIIRTHPGPFDSPEDLLATYLEMIEQAEWKGEQLSFPAIVRE